MKRLKRKIVDSNYSKELTTEERALYKKAIKQVEETNRRLKRLERGVDINKGRYNPKTKRFERTGNITILENGQTRRIKTTQLLKYDVGTWASKKLTQRLESYYNKSTNRITLPKGLKPAELRGIIKATKNFLKSQTSTPKGIKNVENKIKENIANIISDDSDATADDVTSEEAETLYNFFTDSDFNYVTQFIDPSELFVILNYCRENNISENGFLKQIENYIDRDTLYNDADLMDALIRIYHKYVG